MSAVSAAVCARLQLFDQEPFAALSGNYHFICQGHLIVFYKNIDILDIIVSIPKRAK